MSDTAYINPDLAPIEPSQRHWGLKDIAALWISMSACIPTYMLASSLIDEGMNWWQAVLTIFLGNVIVLVPMVLNAHAGTKYGIPFPVYCRASFGILGANVPALLRALVACGWFGIQSWIGGWAIYKIVAIDIPAWEQTRSDPVVGHQCAPARLLPGVLGDQHAGDLPGHRLDPRPAQHQGAASDRARAGAAGLGLPRRRTGSGRCCRSPRSSSRTGPRPASSGRSSSRP